MRTHTAAVVPLSTRGHSLTFFPTTSDGSLMAVAVSGAVVLWDVQSCTVRRVLPIGSKRVCRRAFHGYFMGLSSFSPLVAPRPLPISSQPCFLSCSLCVDISPGLSRECSSCACSHTHTG